jgi:N-acetylglucosamine-1-phosphate uridyltransferase (contains nucleotidyltransferase and I-patch acetyltransferase domains)
MMSMRMAVILAAGKGTRMKSSKPKVLHEVLGKSMVLHVIDNLKASAVDKIVVILGHEAALVKAHLANVENIEFVEQTEQLGTAHALLQAEALLKK